MNGQKLLISSLGLAVLAGLVLLPAPPAAAQVYDSGGQAELDPATIAQYVDPLIIPPAIPRTGKLKLKGGKSIDYYEIAVRQFDQQILPTGMFSCNGGQCPATTVWSYGSLAAPGTVAQGGSFNYPALTIEAKYRKPVRVKWVNQLVVNPDTCGTPLEQPGDCNYLPHLLPVDQTLHWANPPGECANSAMGPTDCRGTSQEPYTGPVPMIVHVHGAETYEWSDGYPEAWYLPDADNIPPGYYTGGSFFNTFQSEAASFATPHPVTWGAGYTVFEYPNDQEATTLWYHDHSLGMTRQNVYAGPAGFYLLRGGPGDMVVGTLPGPAPALGDPPGLDYYEIPIVIQDRSFFADGSLAYPDNRAFFEGIDPANLQVPFIPDETVYPGGTNTGASDVSPIWNPEFFGNTIVVNGRTWPFQNVEPRRYRLRFLNGSQSRFLILQFDNPNVGVWQIGAEQGFLPAPVNIGAGATNGVPGGILLGPAERADMIVDFSTLPAGTTVRLLNWGPDEPFGGGVVDVDFPAADPATTGQVMQFNVVPLKGTDLSTPPGQLLLPAPPVLGAVNNVRRISLNEEESQTVLVAADENGDPIVPITLDLDGVPFGPTEALLGTVNSDGTGNPLTWSDATTENVGMVGATEEWEIYNFTMDAHPIHIHLIQFQVVNREGLDTDADGNAIAFPNGIVRAPEVWETGYKDTVIAYPGEVTRVRAMFPLEGLFVWHCHILEHEDNEMMRPYCVGSSAACQQHNAAAMPMP